MITVPNLVQTTDCFKEVKSVSVGDKVLCSGVWKEVTTPPVHTKCVKFNLSGGFPIIVNKTALNNKKQSTFIVSKFRKFSSEHNKGFYAIPYITDNGYVRFDKNDSRLYKAITCLTREVWTPLGQINGIKPIHLKDSDFSLSSCLDLLEGLVNRGLYVNMHDDVVLKKLDGVSALVLCLLNITVWSDSGYTLVPAHCLYRLFDLVNDVNVDIPDYIFEKAIRYNISGDSDRYYTTVSKETVEDWCLVGMNPDINGVSMVIPNRTDYWTRLLNGKRKRKTKG